MPVSIELFLGQRSELRALFEEADDSANRIDSYIGAGHVMVAREGQRIVGHVQIVERHGEWEITSVAVAEDQRCRGIGARLIRAAIDRVAAAGARRVRVGTALADIGNLRFYQRLGFRAERLEQNAFTPEQGYRDIEIDGIPLRDRLWFSFDCLEPRRA